MHLALALLLLTSNGAASSKSDEPCDAADLTCLHHKILNQAIEIESLGKRLSTSTEIVANSERLIAVWKEQSTVWQSAAKEAADAIRPAAWYTAPVLWFALGFTIATALTVALVYALVPGVR